VATTVVGPERRPDERFIRSGKWRSVALDGVTVRADLQVTSYGLAAVWAGCGVNPVSSFAVLNSRGLLANGFESATREEA